MTDDVDPTANVVALVDSANRRTDDLATERAKRVDGELAHLRELIDVNARHAKELRDAESARVDAVRREDVGNVQRAAAEAEARAGVLAAQVVATADPLRAAIEDLRRSQYEAQGMKSQTTESRLSLGAAVAIVGVVAVILFGIASVVIALITQT